MRREQVTIGRKQISYLIGETPAVSGSRQQPLRTIVFLHAFPLRAEMWEPQIGVPPSGWRMVAPDYRGFGPGGVSPHLDGTKMNDLAGDVIDLLDRLEITETIIAGCSMGGYVAFELLESAPNYVSGLILIDTRATADTDEGKANRRKMIESLAKGGSEAVADEMTPKLLGATTLRDRPDLVKHVRHIITSTNPAAIKMGLVAMMERRDMTASLNTITVPTLIVHGAEDVIVPLTASQQMQDAIKKSQLVTIPFAGHVPPLEQTVPFNVELQKFLSRF